MPKSLNSMTGFGRMDQITDSCRIVAELKSVNHRYLDLSIRMPRRFNCLEARVRKLLKEYLERGKTDLFISYESYEAQGRSVRCNQALAEAYVRCFREMAERYEIPNDAGVSALARCPDVLLAEEQEADEEQLWQLLEPVLRAAAEKFRQTRALEGAHLKQDLLAKLDRMEGFVRTIEETSPSVVEAYRRRLSDRIREMLADSQAAADEGRIVTEVAIYADKICTDEEMVRLKSHIAAMRARLLSGGACGRELDFLAQEMNREANTTLSKAGDLRIADTAILLKTEIEKVREQVQNIE